MVKIIVIIEGVLRKQVTSRLYHRSVITKQYDPLKSPQNEITMTTTNLEDMEHSAGELHEEGEESCKMGCQVLPRFFQDALVTVIIIMCGILTLLVIIGDKIRNQTFGTGKKWRP